MASHTPGEWWLNPDGDEFCSDPVIEGPNGPIATIHHFTRVIGESADARVEWGHFEDGYLIAAAPKLLKIVEVVASLNLSDIGSMKDSDVLYWHGGKLTVAHVREAYRLCAALKGVKP